MLETNASPLARSIGNIGADLRAQATHYAAQSGPVAALHALFLGLILRLFGRLEEIVDLWQQGLLAAPAPRAGRRRRRKAASASVRRRRRAHGRPVQRMTQGTGRVRHRGVTPSAFPTQEARHAQPAAIHAVRSSARAPPARSARSVGTVMRRRSRTP